jgi:hypothetical protein
MAGIRYIPARRFLDPGERIDYEALELLSGGVLAGNQSGSARAIVEPEAITLNELVDDDVIAAVSLIDTNTFSGTFAATNVTAVAQATGELLEEFTQAPQGVSSIDAIVTCDQRDDNLFFTAYIEETDDGLGNTIWNVRFVAKNMGVGSHSVGIGQLIRYSICAGAKVDLPRSINAELIITPGIAWIDPTTRLPFVPNIPITAESLNKAALPALSIRDHSITEIELNSAAIDGLGSKYTGRRDSFTVSATVIIPVGPAVLLGTISFTGPAGPNIAIGADRATPFFTGYVSSSNGVTFVSIYARNNYIANLLVPAGLVLNVFAY